MYNSAVIKMCNNPQAIHMTSINALWSEKLKYESSIQNIAFSSEKVVLSESGEEYGQIKHCLQVKTVQNVFTQI